MSTGHSAIAIFKLATAELRTMIEENMASLQANVAKCDDYLATLTAENDDADRHWGTRIPAVREILGTITRAMRNRMVENKWYLEHLIEGEFCMTGAQLVGFKTAFAPVDLNVERAILSVQDAPKPGGQAERSLASTHVQIPRTSYPDGVLERS